ncbi:MAG: class I SAM-dependent methyltransferase [Rudaea sp.]
MNAQKGLLIDVGCADRFVEKMVSANCAYVGIDHYATATSMYSSSPDIFADAEKLPIATSSVDTVVLFEVLEHVPDPAKVISEISRVLRFNGNLLLSVPFLYPIHDAPYDFHRFTQHALTSQLINSGFAVEQIAPRLKSFETAALMFNLAVADAAQIILKKHKWAALALPVLGLSIVLSNILGWFLSRLLPGSDFMAGGYNVVAIQKK